MVTKWVIKECKRRGLTVLFQPVSPIAYENLVREIYQNLTFDCTRSGILSSFVVDVDIKLTTADIATALQCSHECLFDILARDGTPQYLDLPSGPTVQHIVDDICHGRCTNNLCNCTSKVLLPSRLWLVDVILQRNMCPIGHKTHRCGPFLLALYAFQRGFWFSIP